MEERHAGEWPVMDETLQEEVVDEHFMPPDVHAHYGTLPRSRSRRSVSSRASSRYGDQDDVQLLRNRGSVSLFVLSIMLWVHIMYYSCIQTDRVAENRYSLCK